MIANKLSSLTILLQHTNGITNKINELQFVLKDKNVIIAVITESYLTINSKFKIFGYDCFQANHPDNTTHTDVAPLMSTKILHSPLTPKSN